MSDNEPETETPEMKEIKRLLAAIDRAENKMWFAWAGLKQDLNNDRMMARYVRSLRCLNRLQQLAAGRATP